jgi:hypothetical protein
MFLVHSKSLGATVISHNCLMIVAAFLLLS